MKKKIAVVGAGISGIFSAWYAAKKGNQVEIFETSALPGGVLRENIVNQDLYSSGIQYLNNNENWFISLKKEFKKNDFKIFDVKYGSFTQLGVHKNISNNFPVMVFNSNSKLYTSDKNKKENLRERIDSYPKDLSKNIINWSRRFKINLENLEWNAADNGLNLGRIYIKNREKELLTLKKKNKFLDKIYGVPRNIAGFKKLQAALPVGGYNLFFEKFLKVLTEKYNVKLNFRTPVRTIYNRKKFSLFALGKVSKFDNIVWTANPTSLIKNFLSSDLDSVPLNVRVVSFFLKNRVKNNFYAHVFSDKTSVIKFYVYNSKKKNILYAECFDEKESIFKIKRELNNLINKFNLKNLINSEVKIDQIVKRYILTTKKDRNVLDKFYQEIKQTNLIHAGWDNYSRSDKIRILTNQIDSI